MLFIKLLGYFLIGDKKVPERIHIVFTGSGLAHGPAYFEAFFPGFEAVTAPAVIEGAVRELPAAHPVEPGFSIFFRQLVDLALMLVFEEFDQGNLGLVSSDEKITSDKRLLLQVIFTKISDFHGLTN